LPLEQTVLENGQPLVVADLADYHFAHQELNAQSAVLVPIMYEGYPLGVIHLWANKPGFFDSVSQEIVQTFSFQASTGVANVLRYQDQERQNVLLKQRVETLARLMDSSRMQQISQPLEASLTAIAEAIRDATPFNVILISVYDPAKQVLQRVAGVGFTAENLQEMSRFTQPWRSVQEYLQEEYRFGQIYFIPTERKPVDPPDIHTVYVLPKVEKVPDFDTWHTDDLLLAPLLDGDGSPLGLISVDDPRNNLRPDRPTLDTLELFASQAALTIESHLAVGLFNDKLVDAEQRLVRAEKAAAVTQENLPLLLHKDLEQTVTLYELSQRMRRAQAGLEIAEQLNRQSDREAVLDVLGSQLLIQYGMDVVLIAETAAGGPRLVRAFGTGVERVDLNALLGQRNPLRQSLQMGKMVFSQDLAADTAWQGVALLQAVSAGSFVCFPVGGENNPEIAVLLVNQSPLSFFDREDERLFQMLSRQAGIALRNLRLVTETDQRLQEVNLLLAFSRQLGSLDLSAILDTLLDTALKVAQNAQGGVVLLWDTIRDFLVCHAAKGYAKSEDLLGISYSLAETLPGRVVRERQSMRVDEVNFAHDFFLSQADLLSYRDATQGKLPVSSLLVPIQSGELPLGLLILEDFQMVGGFTPEDQALIDSLAQQAALAMENARLYEGSELRARQLQALTDAAGAMSASLQTEELIQGLLQRLRSLVEFDTGAVWLREGERLTVQAAEGFADEENRIGLEVDIQDSQLFKSMIRSSKPIVVPDVRVDDRFLAIDESPFLSWLGLPLIAKGDVIGVIALQKKESDYYSPESIQVLTAFASQAAVSIQNAMLFDDSLSRAIELDEQTQRLASLNRYTTVLSSSLDQGHILRTVISEIQRQISSTTISIALFDKGGKVQVHAEAPQSAHTLPYDLPDAPVFAWIREHHSLLNCADISLESDLTPLMPFLQEVNTISLLLIPLTAGSELQGVIFVHEGRRRRQFSAEEIDVLQTIAGQATISLQNARLYDETQLRLSELTAINQISQSITTTIDLGELINRLPEQLAAFVDTKNMYLALFDPAGDQVEFPMAYENGEPVELPAGKPAGLTGFILSTKQPLLLVGEDVPARLETLGAQLYGVFDAASYLGVPLLVGERVVGVLAVQSPDLPYAYTVEDVRLLTTVAAQVAAAIENSRLYTETRQRSADLARLLAYSSRIANELDEAKLLEATFSEVQQAFGAELVAVISRMPEGEWCAEFQENGVQQKVNSYFMQTGNLHLQVVESSHPLSATAGEGGFVSNRDFGFEAHVQGEGWVGVPLTARGETFGVLSLAGSRVHRFGEDQLVLLSQVGNQLGTALDSARLFTQVQNYAAELEERVQERTRQLAYEHSRTETLLRIITELSASLDMDIVLNRTLNLINEIVGAEQSTILLVEAGEQVLLRRASVGYTRPTPEGGEALAMRPDEGLSGWVIKRHEAALVADVLVDDRWVQVGKTPTEHRSVMAVPLLVGEEVLGVLMLFHRLPDQFSTDHLDLVQATAKQIAVAINNSKLYRLIRDQAERLGDMLRTQHVEMTRSQAILEAVADGVLVTDSLGQITLFNASAERILQLKRNQVQGRPLESFIGLFGKAARSWMDTIHTWSRQSSSYQAGEVYSERIEMEDGRVVSVHLSPVHLRSEFLGTVSIFRDVTHEVELSRLKSEFVANVSHELRTPMTSIKGYVDILLMGATGDLTEQQRTFLNVVKSNTERLVVLVNDLLEVSRLEAGKVNLVLEPIDLRHMVEEVALEMRQRSVRENRPMNIHVKAAPALERALADPDRIRQVIENLVDNAYHYTPANGDITIRLGDEDNGIRVDIQDTGIGIPLSEQEQVFERFYRGEDPLVLETPGTGLGLSVVKTLVEMHQGRIWLYSSGVPGEGSTFSFVIPVYTEEKKAVGIFPSTPPATR
jgi:PAS domain S-box-containing protein